MFTPTDPLPANVRAALERGSPIEAIKLLRETKGLGLKEAKDVIDHHHGTRHATVAVTAPPVGLPPEVFAALHQDNKIEAIRLMREKTGVGLKQAKETVESFEAQSSAGSIPSPGEVPKMSTGAWLVAALVALLVLGYFVFSSSG